MEIQPDFRDLLELFNKHEVEYLVVGAYALAFHGVPRYTGDLDIYVHPSHDNATRVLAALRDFGFGGLDITRSDLAKPGQVVQLGVPPVRIDILTSITGVSWEEATGGKLTGTYGDVPVSYIGRGEYVTNKRATGRRKDLADLESLGED